MDASHSHPAAPGHRSKRSASGRLSLAAAMLVLAACNGAGTASDAGSAGPMPGAADGSSASTTTWHATGAMSSPRAGHTATLLVDGRVLVAGGMGPTGATAEVFDEGVGRWRATAGAMVVVRTGHTATLLPSGQAIAVSGPLVGDLDTAERYDPATDRWTAIAPPSARHVRGHTATLMMDGRVLVIGGQSGAAEFFDPVSGQWTPTAAMGAPRGQHAATLLPDGRVLVTGGVGSDGVALATAAIYDPTAGGWASAKPMAVPRSRHMALLLADGRVLVAGGGSPELYDPQRDTWSPTATAPTIAGDASATLLPSGDALVITGCTSAASCVPAYDPVANTWTPGATLVGHRSSQTSTLLTSGRVLVVGGSDRDDRPTNTADLSDTAGTWSISAPPPANRLGASMTLMPDGRVLVAGGRISAPASTNTTAFYRVDPASGRATWTPGPPMVEPRAFHSAALLPDGSVVVVGGADRQASERYDPVSNAWAVTGPTSPQHDYLEPALTVLGTGKVLIVGLDCDSQNAIAQIYTYDTRTKAGTFTDTKPMNAANCLQVATLLPGGDVLVVGGRSRSGNADPTAVAEVYDPVAGTWSLTQPLPVACALPYAQLLRDGRVLLVCNGSSFAFAWDAVGKRGQWQTLAPLLYPRDPTNPNDPNAFGNASATMTMLADGTVLVSGGVYSVDPGAALPAERFDPVTGAWTPAGTPLTTRAALATSVLLASGDLLTIGGWDAAHNTVGGSDLLDTRAGALAGAQPVITVVTPLQVGSPVGIEGNLFRGVSEASGGHGGQQSSSAHPVVTLRALDNRHVTQLAVDPLAGWSDSRFTSLPLTGFPAGPAVLTLSVNGVITTPMPVTVQAAAADAASNTRPVTQSLPSAAGRWGLGASIRR